MTASWSPRAVLLSLALCSAAASANKRDYARGVEAADGGDWTKVSQLMGNALADDPEPKDRALMYGTYRRPYIPQYYLALAALKTNDCATALRYLGDARLNLLLSSGGRAASEATQVAAIRTRCTSTQVQTPPLTQNNSKTASADQRQSVKTASDALTRASTEAKAKVALTQLSSALTKAAQAQAALDNALLSTEAATLQRALQLASGATAELKRLSAAASNIAVVTTPVKLPPVNSKPPASNTKVEAAAGLKTALAAFLSGDYQSVVRSKTAGMDSRSTAHTLLLRGAARYSLFLLGGERETALRAQAEADVREARRALSSIRPAPNYFSPRFVRFFEQTR
jgi:hypothetical protein